jgi:hypothetical protein
MERRHCIGSGVPADWFEHGHWIIVGTEEFVFPVNYRASKSGLTRVHRSRCRLCDSTRRYYKRDTDAMRKAVQAHRRHADASVEKGLYPDRDAARAAMNDAGCTVAWLAQQILDAIGKPCPGLCFDPAIIDGKPVAHPHVITRAADIQLDWREPQWPLCPQNAGILEGTCNQQKQGKSWAAFMAIQHALRRNFLHGERLPIQATLF